MYELKVVFQNLTELQGFIASLSYTGNDRIVEQAKAIAPEPTTTEAPPQAASEAPKRRGRPPKSAAPEPASPSEGSPLPSDIDGATSPEAPSASGLINQPAQQTPSLADATAALRQLNGTKGMDAALEVLRQFNAQRISEVKEAHYADFVAACQKAGA